MENKNSYNVSDLSAILQVPRTTLNDWLLKYSRFLDTELKGKRKVYTSKALEVLQDIAKFRNDGIQLLDIDRLLEEKYGIHGEIQDPKVTEKNDENNANDDNLSSNLPVVNNNQVEEMTVLVKNQFEELLLRVEQLNKERNKAIRRTNSLFIMLVLLLFILLGAGGFLGVKLLDRVKAENASTQNKYNEVNSSLTEKIQQSDRKISDFSAETKTALENMVIKLNIRNDELQKKITEQQLEFKTLLEELKKENRALEAETLKNREDYAKKQLELLENMQKSQAELEKIKNDLNESRNAETLLKEKLQKIEDGINKVQLKSQNAPQSPAETIITEEKSND
jgi:hypothetical protein